MQETVLPLVKATLGYRSTVRDTLLKAIIDGIEAEMKNTYGLTPDPKDSEHIMFVCDLTVFRYKNQGGSTMPRNLDYRLKNLIINAVGE